MKTRKKLIITAVIVLGAVGYGISKHHSSAAQDDNAIWVQASTVKQTTMQLDLHAIGALTARSVEITPEVAGHVDKILFGDGATVKQGDPLIQLDDAVYRAKNASAKAQLAYSQNNYKRMILLGKQGAISRQAIDQADADLKEKKAAADESEVMLSKMRLTAPFDGVVGKRKVNPGDYVTVGQSVVTVTDINHLHIEYNLPERNLPTLKVGQTVSVTTAAYPDKQFVGTLSFISPTINTANRSIALYAEVKNNEHELAPGMFVDVMQSLGQQQKVIMVPERSLVPVLDGVQIYKIVEGKAYAVNVEIGRRFDGSVQVLHGLSPNDTVITDGQIKVKNGMPVKIKT
jgi:membrane fusion protein (multidrug efflux system)